MTRPRLQELRRRGAERLADLAAAGAPGTRSIAVRAVTTVLPHRFDPSRAVDLEATIELRIRDPGGGAPASVALRVASGELTVSPGPALAPQATAELGADDMIRLAAGSAAWPELLAAGRMSFTGDPFVALRFPALFRLRAGDGPRPGPPGQPVPAA
jgi:SCP-2 sterol transfer family